MKLRDTGSSFTIKNNVYSGFSPVLRTGFLIRSFSYKDKDTIIEVSSPPASAYLLTGSGNYNSLIYETCHGINQSILANAGKTGDYNFYMAPYGPGYYQPPVGELPTMAEQTFGSSKVFKKQIDDLNLPDYLKIFGLRIASKINNFLPCKSYPLTAFHEGITDCPINSQMAFKYSEIQAELAAGTYIGAIGGNIYNHNPIPSSYDRGVLVAKTLYSSTAVTSQGPDPVTKCFYNSAPDGKTIPVFERTSSATSSNYVFGRCESLSDIDRVPLVVGATDAHTNASVGNPKDIISDGDVGQDASNYDQGVYWHFIFKNNHETLPFGNTHEAAQMTQDNDQTREDYWWEHRECPENIDYLNHAFGNNINACPMNYVDVPYYAAIGKFGYFGTRFQDTWRKIDNDYNEKVGYVPVWTISGNINNSPDSTGPDFESFWATAPEDNSLYKVTKSFSGIKDAVTSGVNAQNGAPISVTGKREYVYEFDIDFLANSGVEPTAVVENSDFSGMLLMVDPAIYTGISWEYVVTGKNSIGIVDQYLGLAPLDPLDKGILCQVALHVISGITGAAETELFDNLDLTLFYFKKLKYVDYPHESGRFYQLKGIGLNGGNTSNEEYYPHSQMIGTSSYEDLISSAAVEKKYYDFAFSDRTLFLNLNYTASTTSAEYVHLASKIPAFTGSYKNLCSPASVLVDSTFKFSDINRGGSHLMHDDPVHSFITQYINTGEFNQDNFSKFTDLIRKYGSFKCNAGGGIDNLWYDRLANEKLKRISRRYYSAIANGNPVDLFPNNQVTFSFEKTLDFANSDLIKYGSVKTSTQAMGKTLPAVKRQYFSAGFSTDFELSGYRDYVDFNTASNTFAGHRLNTAFFNHATVSGVAQSFVGSQWNFYFGYVNPRGCGSENPIGGEFHLNLINLPKVGIWTDRAPHTSPPPAVNTGSPVRAPWPDFGYNKIGRVKPNFSCFSPLFLQQPINENVKLCQAPKFRVYAVDYHSIPEDKIKENGRGGGVTYPEVAYWLRKIKAVNTKGDDLYPLKYQWHRILKTKAQEYITGKNTGLLLSPSSTGPWCCAEDSNGWTPECTVIRPLESLKMDRSPITNWSGYSEDSVSRFMGVRSPDDNYYYFCNVSGRFGWRSSEFAEVTISNQVTVELASMNLCGGGGASLSIAGTAFPLNLPGGIVGDAGVYFEQVKDKNWNDRNNCETVRFIGPERVRGITRVYTPSTFVDPRGKKVRNAHWKDFGQLVSSTITLSFSSAAALYADRALPYCDRSTGFSWGGVPFNLNNYIHRTHFEPALLTDNTTFGVKASKMRNIGELYPPKRYSGMVPDWDARNPGHWQFENNLGSIKKYSSIRAHNTIANVRLLPDGFSTDQVRRNMLMTDFENKIKLAGSKIITGPECGYVAPSMGRLMHFFVETFSTYYLLCEAGGVKPKKVKNFSHIAGGLRSGRAGLQYNWLGKPNDSRLKRVSMPGPYAFQWKVERHNRDRSGNGMPLSFWSYHWEQRMEDLYDAAAVYGAVNKTNPSYSRLAPASAALDANGNAILDANGDPVFNPSDQDIRYAAAIAMSGPGATPVSLRGASIGPDDGPKLGCGSIRWRASGEMGGDKPNSQFVSWMGRVADPAGPDPFSVNGCGGPRSPSCFYPCISLKYPEGFSPKGGKSLGFGQGPVGHRVTSSVIKDPYPNYSYYTNSGPKTYRIFPVELSPCSNNKKDICNYITPTVHVGVDTWPAGLVSNNSLILTSISNM